MVSRSQRFFLSLVLGGFGLVISYLAHELGKPLLVYIRLRSINNQYLEVLQQLGAVVMALAMNVGVLLLNVLGSLVYAICATQSKETPVAIVVIYFGTISVLRLGLFYWQVILLMSLALLYRCVGATIFIVKQCNAFISKFISHLCYSDSINETTAARVHDIKKLLGAIPHDVHSASCVPYLLSWRT
jgi:uncharacterized membrane protein